MKLHDKLFLLRRQNHMSQEQLADKLNVSRQTVSKWELGASIPTIDNLLAISKLFNVSIDYLVDEHVDIETDTRASKTTEAYYKLNYKFALIRIIIIIVAIAISLLVGYLNHSLIIAITAIIFVGLLLIIFLLIRFLLRLFLCRKEKDKTKIESEEHR